MIDEQVEILANDEVAEEFYMARLQAPYIAARANPGSSSIYRSARAVSLY